MAAEQIPDTELDWLAFCYAAGELQGAELDAFEGLLATNERACTALSRAVMLGQGIVQCEQSAAVVTAAPSPIKLVVGSTPHSFSRNRIAACTVACSLLFVGWMFLQTAVRNQSSEAASTVAALWINGADEDSAADSTLPDQDAAELTEEEPVPGWLLAAVTEQQAAEDEEIMLND